MRMPMTIQIVDMTPIPMTQKRGISEEMVNSGTPTGGDGDPLSISLAGPIICPVSVSHTAANM